MTQAQLKNLLEEKYQEYAHPDFFLETDPIQIPHQFKKKEDIEIAGFLTATLAWGTRSQIIKKSLLLMEWLDNSPYAFISQASPKEFEHLKQFIYRTFNGEDCYAFVLGVQNILSQYGSLEPAFNIHTESMAHRLAAFKTAFFSIPHLSRTEKHVANPLKGSSAKRLCMYLRWMVRKDTNSVDFGIWDSISMSDLHLPLDVHSGKVARELGVLKRKQDDWKAVVEVTTALQKFDPKDPCKYDYALFGISAFDKF